MRIDELEMRNNTDCWDILYRNLIGTAILCFGNCINPAIRNAIRLYAKRIAEIEQRLWRVANLPNNLDTLFKHSSLFMSDPRYKRINEKINIEEALFEIVVCPHYTNFKNAGSIELLQPYCEEYSREIVSYLTNSRGQCNLSEMLVQDFSSSCLFSCYYRQANDDNHSISKSQTTSEIGCLPMETITKSQLKTYLFVEACFSEFSKQFNKDSVHRVMSKGLRIAASETALFLSNRASSTNTKVNKDFLKFNCGHDLIDSQKILGRPMDQELLEIYNKNFIEQLIDCVDLDGHDEF